MKNIVLTIAYDGKDYFGWQKTSHGPSIEGTLERVLSTILQEKTILLQASSRTDRGVHANYQVVNFFTSKEIDLLKLQNSLNRLLPKTIVTKKVETLPITFHPSIAAHKKQYYYNISFGTYQLPHLRYYSWHFPYDLDIELMQISSKKLIGCYDFTSFSNKKPTKPICHIFDIEILLMSQYEMQIQITGNRFLYRMARNIAGTLAYVGAKKILPTSLEEILHAKNRKKAGVTPPPHGLVLNKIYY
jgi:tRNA pseudouridine38-40 synthase